MSGRRSELVVAVILAACGGMSEPPGPLTGTWRMTWKGMTATNLTCPDSFLDYQLAQTGDQVRGSVPTVWVRTCSSSGNTVVISADPGEITSGKVDATMISLVAEHGAFSVAGSDFQIRAVEYTGQVAGDSISGDAKWTARGRDNSTVVFTGHFVAAKTP